MDGFYIKTHMSPPHQYGDDVILECVPNVVLSLGVLLFKMGIGFHPFHNDK